MSRAGVVTDRWHGTAGGYSNHHCRCTDCTEAWKQMCDRMKRNRFAHPTPEHVHGTANGYGNYGCRCEPCTTAWTVSCRERHERRKARLAEAKS